MHNLGDSFGFRRSHEDLWSGGEGRFKIPTTGTFLQGDLVEIDPASPGYLKKSATNMPLIPGVRGLLVQYGELFWDAGYTRPTVLNSRDLSATINDQYAVIATGAGIKVWFKNLASVTGGAGRRAYSAETRVTLAGLSVGSLVKWDGSKFVALVGGGSPDSPSVAVGTVTQVTSDGIEITLNA